MNPKPPATMQTVSWEDDLTARLAQHFGGAVSNFSSYLGQNFLVVDHDSVAAVIDYLKSGEGFDYLVDVTAVHYPARDKQFELIYVLYSFPRNQRIRVKTLIIEGQKPQSVMSVHLTANWLEREVFDMFGIEFTGHADLRRILLPDEWRGHPLRRDYNILQMDKVWVTENLGIESAQ